MLPHQLLYYDYDLFSIIIDIRLHAIQSWRFSAVMLIIDNVSIRSSGQNTVQSTANTLHVLNKTMGEFPDNTELSSDIVAVIILCSRQHSALTYQQPAAHLFLRSLCNIGVHGDGREDQIKKWECNFK